MEVSIATTDHDGSVERPQRPTLTGPEDAAVTELRGAVKESHRLLVRLVDTGHMDATTRTAITQFSATLANLHAAVDQVDADWHAAETARIAAERAAAQG